MKKGLVFLLTLLVASSVWAQTFNESQKRVSTEIVKLEKRLSEINDQIYYLSVTLNERIAKANVQYLPKLKKEKFFAKEDSIKLRAEKNKLEQTLKSLKQTTLFGADYRTASDARSNIPEQMSSREYKKRSRSQVYKMSEGLTNGKQEAQGFKGIIINEKKGQGETASFYISRIDIKNVPTVSIVLKPGEEIEWLLPVGTYEVFMVCGSARTSSIFHVDPRVLNWFNGKQVYWGIKKNLSDW